ncbi:MAG: hypothetical protein JSW48_00125 [Betaproteobacteria bacterium]|nr:MAG: hypothetical protein JSW48_00125 [Betaproteobacteria bacterium]
MPWRHLPKGKSVSFASLLDYDFVGLDSATTISRLMADQAAVIRKTLRLRVQVESFATLCKVVESGHRIGVLPEGVARPFEADMKLRLIGLSDRWTRRRMYGGYEALPPIARKLVDHLAPGVHKSLRQRLFPNGGATRQWQ